MAHDIVMPALSAGMEEGTIARWLKAVGDRVAKGEVIAEIETDKATMEFEADREGTIEALLVAEGTTVPVNAAIARMAGAGKTAAVSVEMIAPAVVVEPPREAQAAKTTTKKQRKGVAASPLARRIADQRSVAIEELTGSGPGGRVVRVDVERAVTQAVAQAPVPIPHPGRSFGEHVILTARCEADGVISLCTQLNTRGAAVEIISETDFILKAVALALAEIAPPLTAFTFETQRDDALYSVHIVNAESASLSAIARQRAGTEVAAGAAPPNFKVVQAPPGLEMFAIMSDEAGPVLSIGLTERQPVVCEDGCRPAMVITLTLCAPTTSLTASRWSQVLLSVKHAVETPLIIIA